MATKLSENIAAKLGNCILVANEEKHIGPKYRTRFQPEQYILVHVQHADSEIEGQWLFTETEFKHATTIGLTRSLNKYFNKGKLYLMSLGRYPRYLVKLQDLDQREVVLSIGVGLADRLAERASRHPKSIVKLKTRLFGLF